MSKLFEEAEAILELERTLKVDDYKRFKEISRQIPKDEERNMAWLLEGLFQRIPEIIEKEGNDNFLEEEDK
jgi:hypothetical protein|tara:strand:+ start:1320 stop:1532 length:213 start_codon:yes stop_codon:yes gene_type:complete